MIYDAVDGDVEVRSGALLGLGKVTIVDDLGVMLHVGVVIHVGHVGGQVALGVGLHVSGDILAGDGEASSVVAG